MGQDSPTFERDMVAEKKEKGVPFANQRANERAKTLRHKENLVRTAMRLFRRQGYAATGLQQIVTESEAPKGSIYYYFPEGKEALAAAAVSLAGDLIAKELSHIVETAEGADDIVQGYCQLMARWMEEGGFASGCPIATTVLECAPHSETVTQAGAAAFDQWTQMLAVGFVRYGYQGVEARGLAQMLISAVEGALIVCRVAQNSQPLDNIATRFSVLTRMHEPH